VERLSEREKERIGELSAARAPVWLIHEEVSRSRWAIRRYINSLERPAKPEATRSPLRLSLVEREEISRHLHRLPVDVHAGERCEEGVPVRVTLIRRALVRVVALDEVQKARPNLATYKKVHALVVDRVR
jgi:hypothetical protein